MNQIWKLVGPDGKPYISAVPGTLGGHRSTRIYGRLDCPAALRAIARGGYVTHRVFFLTEEHARAAGYRTVPAPSVSQWRTHAGKHSKAMYRGAGQFMREDGDRPYEPFKSDRWNANTHATHHHAEGSTN